MKACDLIVEKVHDMAILNTIEFKIVDKPAASFNLLDTGKVKIELTVKALESLLKLLKRKKERHLHSMQVAELINETKKNIEDEIEKWNTAVMLNKLYLKSKGIDTTKIFFAKDILWTSWAGDVAAIRESTDDQKHKFILDNLTNKLRRITDATNYGEKTDDIIKLYEVTQPDWEVLRKSINNSKYGFVFYLFVGNIYDDIWSAGPRSEVHCYTPSVWYIDLDKTLAKYEN